MKLYRYIVGSGSVRSSLAIDPGLASTGLCLLKPSGFRIDTVPKAESPTDHAFPELYPVFQRQWQRTLEVVGEELNFSELEVVLEYTFLRGQFSVGITSYLSYLLTILTRVTPVAQIILVPPCCPEYFAKQRSVSNTETGILAKTLFDNLPRVPVHGYDALFQSLMARHKNYLKYLKSGAILRTPNYELIDIKL